MSLISRHLYKSFSRKPVVSDVSISVNKGEVIGLFGPNGAGKTTSFLMMAGLSKPDRGTIFLNERDVTGWPLYQKARLGLRYLPQDKSIFRGMTVEQNIMCVLEVVESSKNTRKKILDRLLDEFGLEHIRRSQASVLSGGERRRVEIARALVGNPQFLLLDEPLAGIDPKSIKDLSLLITYLAQQGMGILVTDHNVKDMLPIVHRAYILHHGKIFQEGPPDLIANSPHVREVYLGESFTL